MVVRNSIVRDAVKQPVDRGRPRPHAVKDCSDMTTVTKPKLATEAPINGGRNYDGPKVAKFLVG